MRAETRLHLVISSLSNNITRFALAPLEPPRPGPVASEARFPRVCMMRADRGRKPHPQMAERIHITTAIFYCNGTPHVGSAYEALAADVVAALAVEPEAAK